MDLMTEITIFVLAAFVGFEVISKVPTTLHTPLMSQTNAIHGIVMLGGLIVIGAADDTLDKVIGTIAIAFGTINVVGGFMVTDRMLGMFAPEAESRPKHSRRLLVFDCGGGRVRGGMTAARRRASSRARTSSRPATSSPSRCSSSASARAPTRPPPSRAT